MRKLIISYDDNYNVKDIDIEGENLKDKTEEEKKKILENYIKGENKHD